MFKRFILIKRNFYEKLCTLYYRYFFDSFGEGSRVYGKVFLQGNITVGHHSSINCNVMIYGDGNVKIGNYCRISASVNIFTINLNLKQPYEKRSHVSKPVSIGDGAWLCAGSIITPGSTIGEGSVIAAGAVVLGSVPPFEMWGGVPAKKLRDLKPSSNNAS